MTVVIGLGAARPHLGAVLPRSEETGCRLSADARRQPCSCEDLPPTLRLLYGLPVDLNAVPGPFLLRLPGIGPARARQIEEARAQRPFESVAALQRLHGIGALTVARLRDSLYVGRDPVCGPALVGEEKKIGGPQDQ